MSTCFALLAPSWKPNHSFWFSAHISRFPKCCSFVLQRTGQSLTLPSCFSLPNPAQSSGSFDLPCTFLPSALLLPWSGLGGDETCLLLFQLIFSSPSQISLYYLLLNISHLLIESVNLSSYCWQHSPAIVFLIHYFVPALKAVSLCARLSHSSWLKAQQIVAYNSQGQTHLSVYLYKYASISPFAFLALFWSNLFPSFHNTGISQLLLGASTGSFSVFLYVSTRLHACLFV